MHAQTPPLREAPKVGSTFDAELLQDLPLGGNVFAALETIQPELIADRFNSGGLNAGEVSRVGGFLASPSQNHYRIGDIDIASPLDGGPLLFPEIRYWQQVDITTGLMPAGIDAPGLVVALQPRRPGRQWSASIEGSLSGASLVSAEPSAAPPIARLHDWVNGSVVLAGPVTPRLGIVVGTAWTRNAKVTRADASLVRGDVKSAFVNSVLTPATGAELRTLVLVQRVHAPAPSPERQPASSARDLTGHVQSTYERRAPDAIAWRIFGGYTQRGRTRDAASTVSFIVDRLVDGPVQTYAQHGHVSESRWTVGARLTPRRIRVRHSLQFGADVEGTRSRQSDPFAGLIGEVVDASPARLWAYTSADGDSRRRAVTLAVFVSDRIALSPRLALEAALRFEAVGGHAVDSAFDIAWRTWLPSARVRWDIGTRYDLTFVTGYTRSANRLLLGLLSHGDPHAPVADVFRWDGAAMLGPLVARAGPGTGGDNAFSAIDPVLERPMTGEFVIALESRPNQALQFGVTGIARRQSRLINVVNTGVPQASYDAFTVRDANVDLINSSDDQDLPVFNRSPASFGRDRYLLTNPSQDAATAGAVIVSAKVSTERLFLFVGATASAAVGSGGSRGYRASENDQDGIGELFTNPNALTYARGRLFTDRAYVIKWTTIYRFPKQIRLGVIARYQDGQPFSRLVTIPGLNQGTDFVRAFAAGRSRFAFTGTLDVRLQKGIPLGHARLDLIVDAYNLLNMDKEVEEYVVTGDRFRTPTAVQPPRAIHIGLRATF